MDSKCVCDTQPAIKCHKHATKFMRNFNETQTGSNVLYQYTLMYIQANTHTHSITHASIYMQCIHVGLANERVALHDSTSKWGLKKIAPHTQRDEVHETSFSCGKQARSVPQRDVAASCLIARRDKCRERVLPNSWFAGSWLWFWLWLWLCLCLYRCLWLWLSDWNRNWISGDCGIWQRRWHK